MMNNKMSYNGVVTLVQRVNNKTVSTRYYNNGTNRLFEAYSRALAGEPIDTYLPSYLNIFDVRESLDGEGVVMDEEEVNVTNTPISILRSYKGANTDGGNYGVPYLRISNVILKSMLNLKECTNTSRLKLYSSNDVTDDSSLLASVDVSNLGDLLKDAGGGVQLLILWDLYVTNSTNDNGGSE